MEHEGRDRGPAPMRRPGGGPERSEEQAVSQKRGEATNYSMSR